MQKARMEPMEEIQVPPSKEVMAIQTAATLL
jgi:hypothetical protein